MWESRRTLSTHLAIHQSEDEYARAVTVAARTSVGMRRRTNQDSFIVVMSDGAAGWRRNGHLLIVADGMGAHAAGEKASKMATEGIPHYYAKYPEGLAVERLHRAMNDTNADIFRRGQATPEFRSMGTTASSLLLLPEGAVCAHVGDSRVYRLRGGTIEQLTFDHSLVWEMQEAGKYNDETINASGIPKNVITRSLGPNQSVLVDLEGPFPLRRGDKFLLCSDGLTGQLNNVELATLMALLTPQEAVDAMVDLANLRGGPDNITAVIAEIVGDQVTASAASLAGEEKKGTAPRFSAALAATSVACAVATAALLYSGQTPLALVTTALAAIALAAGLAQLASGPSLSRGRGERYGKGPYRQAPVHPDQPMVEGFMRTLEELREASLENQWSLDWSALDEPESPLNSALRKQDHRRAVRELAIQLTAAVRQIPRGLQEQDSDSIF